MAGGVGSVINAAASAGLEGEKEVVVRAVYFGTKVVGLLPAVAPADRVVDVIAALPAIAIAGEVEGALFVTIVGGDVIAVAVDGGTEISAVAGFAFGY